MPNFQLLSQEAMIIQIHAYAAIAALFLGACVLYARKGTNSHRMWGKLWIGIMVIVAGTSFWINGIRLIGPFSPIHLLSVLTLWSVYKGVRHARSGEITAHKKNMKSLFLYSLIGAGIFTLLPGRLMFRVFFG